MQEGEATLDKERLLESKNLSQRRAGPSERSCSEKTGVETIYGLAMPDLPTQSNSAVRGAIACVTSWAQLCNETNPYGVNCKEELRHSYVLVKFVLNYATDA